GRPTGPAPWWCPCCWPARPPRRSPPRRVSRPWSGSARGGEPGMLIAVASVKGAPGVTTLALGLAALWPELGAVLVECDPDGGDLAARFGHHPDPGLASLAAAARTGSRAVPLAGHVQRLAGRAPGALGPPP